MRMVGLVAGSLLLAGSAAAADGVARYQAEGVQVYSCHLGKWALKQPDATLTGPGGPVKHGAGPSWKAPDGSVVFGRVVASIPAPRPTDVAWLVLEATRHDGDGAMSRVGHVLRTDTHGGVAPASGCDASHEGDTARVTYHAVYTLLDMPAG